MNDKALDLQSEGSSVLDYMVALVFSDSFFGRNKHFGTQTHKAKDLKTRFSVCLQVNPDVVTDELGRTVFFRP